MIDPMVKKIVRYFSNVAQRNIWSEVLIRWWAQMCDEDWTGAFEDEEMIQKFKPGWEKKRKQMPPLWFQILKRKQEGLASPSKRPAEPDGS